jgi:hypothetical protein
MKEKNKKREDTLSLEGLIVVHWHHKIGIPIKLAGGRQD